MSRYRRPSLVDILEPYHLAPEHGEGAGEPAPVLTVPAAHTSGRPRAKPGDRDAPGSLA